VQPSPSAEGEAGEQRRLAEELAARSRDERRARRTLVGPHRDPIALTIDGAEAAEQASAGQCRSLLLALSLLLFSRLGPSTLCLALAIAALSALYSLPRFNWKGRPLLSSAAHLAGGVLHFLLGYSLGNAIDRRGLATATFFALTFAAGHLTQEIRDHQGDVLNAIRTNAVAFGQRRTFAASLVFFTLAHALLLLLSLQGILPRPLAALVVLYPIHLRWSLETLAEGLTYAGIRRLQARYRALYAIVGLAMVAALCGAPGHPQSARGEDARFGGLQAAGSE